jgi:hypothetical protein
MGIIAESTKYDVWPGIIIFPVLASSRLFQISSLLQAKRIIDNITKSKNELRIAKDFTSSLSEGDEQAICQPPKKTFQ